MQSEVVVVGAPEVVVEQTCIADGQAVVLLRIVQIPSIVSRGLRNDAEDKCIGLCRCRADAAIVISCATSLCIGADIVACTFIVIVTQSESIRRIGILSEYECLRIGRAYIFGEAQSNASSTATIPCSTIASLHGQQFAVSICNIVLANDTIAMTCETTRICPEVHLGILHIVIYQLFAQVEGCLTHGCNGSHFRQGCLLSFYCFVGIIVLRHIECSRTDICQVGILSYHLVVLVGHYEGAVGQAEVIEYHPLTAVAIFLLMDAHLNRSGIPTIITSEDVCRNSLTKGSIIFLEVFGE